MDAALKSVNLLSSEVVNKLVGKYSGGMKRRLSVAISFMGDPKVIARPPRLKYWEHMMELVTCGPPVMYFVGVWGILVWGLGFLVWAC